MEIEIKHKQVILIDIHRAETLLTYYPVQKFNPKYGDVRLVKKNRVLFSFLDDNGHEIDVWIKKSKLNYYDFSDLKDNDRIAFNIIKYEGKIHYWFEKLPLIVVTAEEIYKTIKELEDNKTFDFDD